MDSLLSMMDSQGNKGPLAILGGLGGMAGLETGGGESVQDIINVVLGLVSPQILAMVESKVSSVLSSVSNPECSDAMSAYLDGLVRPVPEIWALRMMDATGKLPQSMLTGATAILGDYDECIETKGPGFMGQYCLLTACISLHGQPCDRDPLEGLGRFHVALQNEIAKGNVNWTTIAHASRGLPYRLGLCVPSTCSAADVLAVAHSVMDIAKTKAGDFLSIEMGADECRRVGDSDYEGYDYIALFLLMFICLMVGAGTAYDIFTKGRNKARSILLMAFSAKSNLSRLFETSDVEGSLPALDGVRVLSMWWIVTCHSFFVTGHTPVGNANHIPEMLTYRSISLIASSFLSVDTFLMMSGMLVSYVYLRRSAMGRSVSIIGYYLHRMARLFPSLGLILLLNSTILMKLRDGPLWRRQPDYECSETWWYIFLQICNYFRPETVQCMVHLWYLSLDWQLYCLAPLALIWMRRRPRQVLTALLTICVCGTIWKFWVSYDGNHEVPWSGKYTRRTMEAVYFPTHMRFAPYLMGLALGYEIHRVKHLKYPPFFSKGQLALMQIAWPLILAGCISWIYNHLQVLEPTTRLSEATHITFIHIFWAVGIGILLYLCSIGYAGPVGSFLSKGWWRPLGCLSFGVYLLHMPLYNSFVQDTRQLNRADVWRMITDGCSCFFLAHIPALALWLGVDMPVARLMSSLDGSRKEDVKRHSTNDQCSRDKSAKELEYIQISKGDLKSKDQNI